MSEHLENESGYSLVEVLAAIVILSIAIIPMVTMFDTGLRLATTSGNYDEARALANQKLEEAKSLLYESAKTNFPETPPATTSYNGSGFYQSGWKAAGGGMEYMVEKQFLARPDGRAEQPFSTANADDGLLKVKVTVRWSGGNEYNATGVVT